MAIRDGQAAFEFRSHYAGKTRIRATSPGLLDATFEIVTTGPERFVPGKSPLARMRQVAGHGGAAKAGGAPQSVSRDKPTSSSLSAPDSSPRWANDGDSQTSWRSAPGAPATWAVDLENIYDVRSIRIEGPAATAGSLLVESSQDRSAWSPLGAAQYRDGRFQLDCPPGVIRARFIRGRFESLPEGQAASISEFQVLAVPAN